eukprot:TRINITY_DN12639_c0_g1_i1.p1 TRINITY_DN12639_c0_g1~~TRINITY_DN12639_c0_g1_i1.p1  ORF type:complete len:481 (-),score=72.56 TRINITY_DN12639_c0_g1_i1:5-1447(-)
MGFKDQDQKSKKKKKMMGEIFNNYNTVESRLNFKKTLSYIDVIIPRINIKKFFIYGLIVTIVLSLFVAMIPTSILISVFNYNDGIINEWNETNCTITDVLNPSSSKVQYVVEYRSNNNVNMISDIKPNSESEYYYGDGEVVSCLYNPSDEKNVMFKAFVSQNVHDYQVSLSWVPITFFFSTILIQIGCFASILYTKVVKTIKSNNVDPNEAFFNYSSNTNFERNPYGKVLIDYPGGDNEMEQFVNENDSKDGFYDTSIMNQDDDDDDELNQYKNKLINQLTDPLYYINEEENRRISTVTLSTKHKEYISEFIMFLNERERELLNSNNRDDVKGVVKYYSYRCYYIFYFLFVVLGFLMMLSLDFGLSFGYYNQSIYNFLLIQFTVIPICGIFSVIILPFLLVSNHSTGYIIITSKRLLFIHKNNALTKEYPFKVVTMTLDPSSIFLSENNLLIYNGKSYFCPNSENISSICNDIIRSNLSP